MLLQLELESKKIYSLLRTADGLASKLQRSKEKVHHSKETIARLTSDNIRLQKDTSQLKHKLELSRVSIQRNSEQHALAVQVLQKNWDVERLRYQQQLEEFRKKVVDQNDRDRRQWARKSFSLPLSADDESSKSSGTKEGIALHSSVSFDAWESGESTCGVSFDDAWASGGSGSGDSHATASSAAAAAAAAARDASSAAAARSKKSESRAKEASKKAAAAETTTRARTTEINTEQAPATLGASMVPAKGDQGDQSEPRNDPRPRFYSATEEEEEGATVILLDSMIRSPDFSYFEDNSTRNTLDGGGGRSGGDGGGGGGDKSQSRSTSAAVQDVQEQRKHPHQPLRQSTQQPQRPHSAPPVPTIISVNGTATSESSTSSPSNRFDGAERHSSPLSTNGLLRQDGCSAAPSSSSRRVRTGANMWEQTSEAAASAAVAATRENQHYGLTKEQDSSLSLGDDDKSLLLRLLLAPEMMLVSAILAAVPPRDKTLLQNPLMRLFASHGKVARLLQWSIDLEVSGTQSPTTLFRSDSYASRMLSTFTKSVGVSYLRGVLSPTLRIIADNADSLHRYRVSTFEVNRQTIHDFGGSSDTSATNLTKLILQVECVIEAVVRAERLLPQSFRHLCHYLFGAVTSRFQDSGHNAVGALLFLRFLCPALAAPEAFGISMPRSRSSSPAFVTRDINGVAMPSPAERRSKMLITKLLQKVVSGIPFSERETEMYAANSFILEKHEEIKRMLMRVCIPDDTYANMEGAVAQDWARHQQHGLLRSNEAMRTVRSLLVQNFARIDDELPPVAFVLRNKFKEALSIPVVGGGSKSKKKRTSPAGRPKKGPGMDARLLAFVAKDLGL